MKHSYLVAAVFFVLAIAAVGAQDDDDAPIDDTCGGLAGGALPQPRVTHLHNERDLQTYEPNPVKFGNIANQKGSPYWPFDNFMHAWVHFDMKDIKYKPPRTSFGAVLDLRDIYVMPQRGFGTQTRENLDIVQYVVEGQITHHDNHNTTEAVNKDFMMHMSTGAGITMSQHNRVRKEYMRMIQIHLQPRGKMLNTTVYQARKVSEQRRQGRWCHVLGDVRDAVCPLTDTPVDTSKEADNVLMRFDHDVNIYVSELEEGTMEEFKVKAGRQVYVVIIEAEKAFVAYEDEYELDGEFNVEKHDAIEAVGPVNLQFDTVEKKMRVMVIEMSACS